MITRLGYGTCVLVQQGILYNLAPHADSLHQKTRVSRRARMDLPVNDKRSCFTGLSYSLPLPTYAYPE